MTARIPTRLKFVTPTLLLLALTGLSSCAMKKPPLRTVPFVDLKRYMGDWYVISHLPNSLEKGKVGTIDRYQLRPDGRIDNAFLFHKGSLDAPLQQWKALAWVYNMQTNAEWRVQFIWPLRSPYLVIDLDKNYHWSVVGHPKRKLGWVLSKSPTMDEHTYQGILDRLFKQGYDVSKFEKVAQKK
ncbi:lipocalin family protein [Prosthecobacter sp.]|uniref:lipocalin family protein n=1 Tax=Prosthecobacter sp. TaxID=1965333 RepID=UPI00378379FD